MARKGRITVCGAVHHVMSRGIEGCPIYRDDTDREFFKSLIEKNLIKSGFLLYAWCLMENHYHLVVRINEYPLSQFMRLLNGPYAQYFRKNQKLRGYLFQDRFTSIATQDQVYVEELIRYVHLNPVRAGICKTMNDLIHYPWCGHAVVMGVRRWACQNTEDVLRRFSRDPKESRMKYAQFLEKGIGRDSKLFEIIRNNNNAIEDIHNTGCWVIGNKEFVSSAIERDTNRRHIPAEHIREGITLEHIAKDVCKRLNIDICELKRKGRNNPRSNARKIAAFIGSSRYQIPIIAIARYFGVTSSSVSNMLREGEFLTQRMKIPLNY